MRWLILLLVLLISSCGSHNITYSYKTVPKISKERLKYPELKSIDLYQKRTIYEKDNVTALAFSPDGKLLSSSSRNGEGIRIYDINSGRLLYILESKSSNVVAFSPDGSLLAGTSYDIAKEIRIWDVNSGGLIKRIKVDNYIDSMAFLDNKTIIFSKFSQALANFNNAVFLLDIDTGRYIPFKDLNIGKSIVKIQPDGKALVYMPRSDRLTIYHLREKGIKRVVYGTDISIVYGRSFSPDDRFLAFTWGGDGVRIWDLRTGKTVKTIKAHTQLVNVTAFSPDGRYFASGGNDKKIKVWDVNSHFYTVTPLKVKLSNGKMLSVPKGKVIKIEKGYILLKSKRFKGEIVKGKLRPIYKVLNPVLFIKETKLKKYPDKLDYRYIVKEGTISANLYCTGYFEVCYYEGKNKNGFFKSDSIVRLDKVDKLIQIAKANKVKKLPFGEDGDLIQSGSIVRAVYYSPYFDAYYVRFKDKNGWVSRSNTNEIRFKKVNLKVLVKEDTPVYLSPDSNTVIGYVYKGERLKIKKKLINQDLFYVETKNIAGFIKGSNLEIVDEVSQEETSENVEVDIHKPFIKMKKEGDKIILIVADDSEIQEIYVNGEPVLEYEEVDYIEDIPYEPSDLRKIELGLKDKILVEVEDLKGNKSIVEGRLKNGELIIVKSDADSLNPAHKDQVVNNKGIPSLTLKISLIDEDMDKVLEGKEKIKLNVVGVNSGAVTAKDVTLRLINGSKIGLPESIVIGDIQPGSSVSKSFTFKLKEKLKGEHKLSFYLETIEGFESNEIVFTFIGKDFKKPQFVIDYGIKDGDGDGKLEGGEVATIYLIVRNNGGDANNVKIKIKLPDGVRLIEGNLNQKIRNMPSGSYKKIPLTVAVTHRFVRLNKFLPISININGEHINFKKKIDLALGEYIKPVEEIAVVPEKKPIDVVSSDFILNLQDLPKPSKYREDALALVIGIGEYKNLPPSKYSEYDGILMKEIFEKVYKIKTYTLINEDATYAQIKSILNKIIGSAEEKKVYIYYSGHGFVKGNLPTIVPYDMPKTLDPDLMFSLQEILNEIREFGSPERVVIVSDSCFSGVGRDSVKLMSDARPVFLAPKELILPEKSIYISATDESGKSYSDRKLKHGILTYYIAKGLIEGDKDRDNLLELDEIMEYVNKAKKHALSLGFTDQNPTVKTNTLNVFIEKK
ncbi:WD40 domain-containing protein [Persephonella sp.]